MKRMLTLVAVAAVFVLAIAAGSNALGPSPAQAGSVTVGVALWQDANFGGVATLITTSQPDLSNFFGDNWANQASSLKVLGGIVIAAYTGTNYTGTCEPFVGEDPWLGNNRVGNDAIQSVKLNATCEGAVTFPVITDMTVVAGGNANVACPEDYVKKDQELNEGAGGDYIYLCLKEGQKAAANYVHDVQIEFYSGNPLYGTSLFESACDGTFIDQDLNSNAGGDYIFLCYYKGGQELFDSTKRIDGVFRDIEFVSTDQQPYLNSDALQSSCANQFPDFAAGYLSTLQVHLYYNDYTSLDNTALPYDDLNYGTKSDKIILMCALNYDWQLAPQDTTPPTIQLTSRTPVNTHGWNNTDVTLTWSCTDSGSGVVAATVTQTVTTEGRDQSATGTCTDQAGNTATDTVTDINIDKTPPTISQLDRTPANAAGWNKSAVEVFWYCSDSLSGPLVTPISQTVTTEGNDQTVTGTCTDLAGNTASNTESGVNIDKTPPTIVPSMRTPADAAGWNSSDVTVTWQCVDALSGPVAATETQIVSGEGRDQSATGTCSDQAGNTASDTQTGINIDKTAPTTPAATLDGTSFDVNGLTWFKDRVDISYSGSSDPTLADGSPGSGLASYSAPQTFTTSGRLPFAGAATDNAGNVSAPMSGIVFVDATPPSYQCDAPDTAWHATDVTIHCTASDGESGLANAGNASFTFGASTAGFTVTTSVAAGTETSSASTGSAQVCDAVGHCVTAGPFIGIKVDKRAPSIALTTPGANSAYLLNQRVSARYRCDDTGSGVATCAGPVASGSAIDTASVGTKSFAVKATDQVGNADSASTSYTVSYGITALYDQTQARSSRGVIPIKLQLVDAANANVSASDVTVTAVDIDGGATVPAAVGGAGSSNLFRYDASLGGYILTLKSAGLTSGTHTLDFRVAGDPVVHSVSFVIK